MPRDERRIGRCGAWLEAARRSGSAPRVGHLPGADEPREYAPGPRQNSVHEELSGSTDAYASLERSIRSADFLRDFRLPDRVDHHPAMGLAFEGQHLGFLPVAVCADRAATLDAARDSERIPFRALQKFCGKREDGRAWPRTSRGADVSRERSGSHAGVSSCQLGRALVAFRGGRCFIFSSPLWRGFSGAGGS